MRNAIQYCWVTKNFKNASMPIRILGSENDELKLEVIGSSEYPQGTFRCFTVNYTYFKPQIVYFKYNIML